MADGKIRKIVRDMMAVSLMRHTEDFVRRPDETYVLLLVVLHVHVRSRVRVHVPTCRYVRS